MKNKQDSLNEEQRAILVGLLLGDGHLETQNNCRTYRLKVEHSEVQADYSKWLFKKFEHLCDQKEVYRRVRKDGRISVGFTTRSTGIFRFYAQQFYVERKKRIPPMIHKMLTKVGLAIWFMDDGSRKSARHHTYNIHTLGYTKSDLEFMKNKLDSLFRIQVTLHKQRNNSWRLYIGSHSAPDFTKLVKPYVQKIPSMRKKLVNINA